MSKQKNNAKRHAQAKNTSSQVKEQQKRVRRVWALPVIFIFFAALWWWAGSYYGPALRTCREYSFWVANPEQMKYVLDCQNGWLWYVGRMLLQLFRYPWLGGLLMAVMLTVASWLLGYTLRLNARWRWLQYLPVLLGLGFMEYQGLDLFFEKETGKILGIPMFITCLIIACALIVCLARKGRVIVMERGREGLCSLAVVVLGFVLLVGYNQWKRPYVRVISQLMEAQWNQDWSRIQKVARSHAEMSNRPMAAYYAISLVHTNQICDRLYDIRLEFDTLHVHGMSGEVNPAVNLYIPEGSYHGGFILTCIHQCMEQMVMTGPTVRLLHLFVKASLMRGEWDVVEKYLRILRDVPFEGDFCEKYSKMVRHPELVNSDPEMAQIRLTEPMHDSFESMYQQPTFLGYNLRLTEGRSLNALQNSLAVCLYTKLLHDFVARLNVLRGTTPSENVADGILLATTNYPGLEKSFMNLNIREPRLQAFMNVIQPFMQTRAEHADEFFPRYKGYYPYYYFFGNLRATNASQKGYVSSNSGVN